MTLRGLHVYFNDSNGLKLKKNITITRKNKFKDQNKKKLKKKYKSQYNLIIFYNINS